MVPGVRFCPTVRDAPSTGFKSGVVSALTGVGTANSQRDINIAFMNEIAMICDRMHIDTDEVLAGMNTKWNALGFKPGLVGGLDPIFQSTPHLSPDSFSMIGTQISSVTPGYTVDSKTTMVPGVRFCPTVRDAPVLLEK